MNPLISFLPIAVVVIAISTPTHASTVDSNQTQNDQKNSITQSSTVNKNLVAQASPKKTDPVMFDGVALMTPEKELEGNIDVADLSNFIVSVETQVRKIFAANKQPGIIVLSFTSTPTKQDVKLAFQPNEQAPKKLLQQLMNTIGESKQLKVKSNSVSFVVQFTLNP